MSRRTEKRRYGKYNKFDVVYADFGKNPHGIQGGIRPGIIISCPVILLPTDTLQCKLLCKSVTDYSIVMSNLSWTIDILQCTLILRK